MRIFYDGLIYGCYLERPGGISNFFDHLISRVSRYHDCLLTSSRPRSLPHPNGPNLRLLRRGLHLHPYFIDKKFDRAYTRALCAYYNPDIIHATYYTRSLLYGLRKPVVFTAYDMIHEAWSDDIDPQGFARRQKKYCFEHAAAIPCISNSTRNDLLSLYPHLESKVSVIYLAGTPKLAAIEPMHSSYDLSKQIYLLYVGGRTSYKNFSRFVRAFTQISCKCSSVRLKVAGAPFTEDEINMLNALKINDKVDIYPNVADSFLCALYRNALSFVYPSLYEGFGLPVLEAMSLNTPVLASNISSIPEVAGNAALLFDPWSVVSIADAILQIVNRPELREDLRRKGAIQCKKFSWEKTAQEYLSLYCKVVYDSR